MKGMVSILTTIAMIAILTIAVTVSINTWTLGSDEGDYETICIGGHEYWRANFSQKGFLGIKLDDGGLPVKCESSND